MKDLLGINAGKPQVFSAKSVINRVRAGFYSDPITVTPLQNVGV
jgi:hypothetical protein